MPDNKIIVHLQKILGTNYVLYTKSQNYHWNVTGPEFNSLHSLFEGQYEDLVSANDMLAERIRALGKKSPGTLKEMLELSIIEEGNSDNNSQDMLKDLLTSHESLISLLKEGEEIATNAGDNATADILNGRIEEHQKHAWMLRSSLS